MLAEPTNGFSLLPQEIPIALARGDYRCAANS
jgi:hypothetical protein